MRMHAHDASRQGRLWSVWRLATTFDSARVNDHGSHPFLCIAIRIPKYRTSLFVALFRLLKRFGLRYD
jgi:hypothetical protein